jgi:Holliday junction resolvase-like predicted endonuclease
LGGEETEDLIFIYLQMHGWVVIPNSRKIDTMSYEFYLIHRDTREKAIVQVKTGHSSLTPADWINRNEKVFLFQANGKYHGESVENVICIDPEEIKVFMYSYKDLLPVQISHWLDV